MFFRKIILFIRDFIITVQNSILKKPRQPIFKGPIYIKLLDIYNFFYLTFSILKVQKQLYNCQIKQIQLKDKYKQLLENNLNFPKLSDVGYRVFSQSDEDGILNYIFSLIGTTNKICLEIAFPSPYGANTTNLIINDNWNGILVCGMRSEKRKTENFFSSHEDTFLNIPRVFHKWITMENVNEVVKNGLDQYNFHGNQIDLFSLDIDGVDYWIWKALEIVAPRVVVVEYQNLWGNRSITIPYKPDFNRYNIHPLYIGATLRAFVKLAKKKGYRLVGANRSLYNAFFVKNGIGEDILPEVSYKECSYLHAQNKIYERWLAVKKFEWTEI